MQKLLWEKGKPALAYDSLSRLRRQSLRLGVMLLVFAVGVIGIFLDYTYTLRAAFGSLLILAFLRYRYALLIAWALVAALIGSSSLPLFEGQNIASGIIIPTLLVMVCLPVRKTVKRVPALLFLLLFVLWVLAGIPISPLSIAASLTQWLIYLSFVAVGVLTTNTLTTERRVMGLIDAILLSSTFIALQGIYGYFTHQFGAVDPQVGFRINSVFGSSPTLGLFLSLIFPLAIYRTLTLSRSKRLVGSMATLVILLALLLTFARGAIITVLLSGLLLTFFLPSRKMRVGLLGALAALVALVSLLALGAGIPILTRFFNPEYATLNGRTAIWQILLSRFDPTQILGNGLNASGTLLAQLGVNAHRGVSVSSYEAHNLFVATLYDQGIIGLMLLLLVFGAFFIGLVAEMRKTTGTRRLLCITACAVLVSGFVQSFEGIDLLFLGIGSYFLIILTLPFALCWSAQKQTPKLAREALDAHGRR